MPSPNRVTRFRRAYQEPQFLFDARRPMSAPTAQAISAGRTKQTSAWPIQSNAPGAAAYIAPSAYNGALYVLTDRGELVCIR